MSAAEQEEPKKQKAEHSACPAVCLIAFLLSRRNQILKKVLDQIN
jgi:hypothetical protein